MVKINVDKCIGCGKCIKECFPGNLELREGKAGVIGSCMQCGHCFAVCPADAVRISDYPMDGIIDLGQGNPKPDGEMLLNLIKTRRSIRNYKYKPIAPEKMMRILEAGRFIPTGSNAQDVRYVVVQEHLNVLKQIIWRGFETFLEAISEKGSPEKRYQKMFRHMWDEHCRNAEKDGLFFNAPALLIVLTDSPLNGGLASSAVELMANAEGLGVLYSGFIRRILVRNEEACRYLGIDNAKICNCMLMGYPDVSFVRSVPRKPVQIQWM